MKGQVPLISRMATQVSAHAAAWAAGACVLALAMFGRGVDGYSHLQHPVAWLGATPLPHAAGFNLLVFVVPGVLVAWTTLRFRAALSAAHGGSNPIGWCARVGAQLMLLSALAFALQGVLSLDATDLDGARSGRHAAAWMGWWIACTSGGALLALGLRGRGEWRASAAFSWWAAVLVPICALALPQLLPAGLAQRLAFAVWFAWAIHAGMTANRRLR